MKKFDSLGQRLTDCCGTYSTYADDGMGGDMVVLVCRACYGLVEDGEGDGTEFREGVSARDYERAVYEDGAVPVLPSQEAS